MVEETSVREVNNSFSPFMQQHPTKPVRNYLTEDDSIMFTLDPNEERKQSDYATFGERFSPSPVEFPSKATIITMQEYMSGEEGMPNHELRGKNFIYYVSVNIYFLDSPEGNMITQNLTYSQDKRMTPSIVRNLIY